MQLSLLFLVLWCMHQEVLLHIGLGELFIHPHKQLLSFGINIAHVHTPFVVEKHTVPPTGSIDAHIEFFLLWHRSKG